MGNCVQNMAGMCATVLFVLQGGPLGQRMRWRMSGNPWKADQCSITTVLVYCCGAKNTV